MKRLSLTAWQRTQLLHFLRNPDQRGTFDDLVVAIKLFNILELSEDEKKEIGWREEPLHVFCPQCNAPVPVPGETAGRWDDTKREFELEIEDADFEMLAAAVRWGGWPRASARLVVPMLKKLKDVAKAEDPTGPPQV